MATSRTVRVDDLDLHVLTAGEGPPVLFLHGTPTHSGLWAGVIDAVGAAGRRAIAVDLPGFGASSKPVDVRYTWRFYEAALDGLLEAEGIERTGLVVHDLGGPIGLHWAVARAERITDLAVLNTVAFPELSWAVKAFAAGLHLPGAGRVWGSRFGMRTSLRLGLRRRRVDADLVERFWCHRDAGARDVLVRTTRDLHPRGFGEVAAGLSRLDVPTTLLLAGRDVILPHAGRTMDRLQAIWPHATRATFADCGHFLPLDAPEEVGAHLAAFLGAVTQRAAG